MALDNILESVLLAEELCNQPSVFTGIVYCYTNTSSDKRYVGQTKHPKDRHQTHLSSSNRMSNRKDKNLPFHCAIRKYGIEQFSYQVLKYVAAVSKKELQQQLNEYEKYFISKFNTLDKRYGYNILSGGNSGSLDGSHPNCVKVHQYSLTGEWLATFPSIKDAERVTGIKGIASALHSQRGSMRTCVFVKDGDELPNDIFGRNKKRQIHQYSILGECVASFPSARIAAQVVGGDQSRIMLCAKPPYSNIAYGFRWSNTKVYKLSSSPACLPVEVHQYAPNGEYIATYANIQMAARAFGKHSATHISLCIRDIWRKAYGFYWRTYKVDKIDMPCKKGGIYG